MSQFRDSEPRFAHDFDNDARASVGFDYAALDEADDAETLDLVRPHVEAGDAIVRAMIWVKSQKRKAYSVDCFIIACGSGALLGEKMNATARRHGVSTQAVCKKVAAIQISFHLPKNRHNKSREAGIEYAKHNHRPTKFGGIYD